MRKFGISGSAKKRVQYNNLTPRDWNADCVTPDSAGGSGRPFKRKWFEPDQECSETLTVNGPTGPSGASGVADSGERLQTLVLRRTKEADHPGEEWKSKSEKRINKLEETVRQMRT